MRINRNYGKKTLEEKKGSLRSIIWEFMGKMWKKFVDIGDKILRQKYVNHSDSNYCRNKINL